MIYKYLLEIKYRIFFSFIAWCFAMMNCYYFKETLLYVFMSFSLMQSNNSDLLYFLTTDVAEVFVTYLQLSVYVTNQMTMMFLCCQIFIFMSTGLYAFEYTYFKTVMMIATVCWLMFVFMMNSFIFPTSWGFFLKFQEFLSFQKLTFYFEAKLNEYLIFYKSMYYFCNLVYQLVILFCIFLDLFKMNLLIVKKLSKIFYFLFFIFSTFVTPPEVMFQLGISVCMMMIYELITIYVILKTELIDFK